MKRIVRKMRVKILMRINLNKESKRIRNKLIRMMKVKIMMKSMMMKKIKTVRQRNLK